MYRIGEFSLLKNVTIKTLRYYDEINLFKPAITDKYTGYRYYQEDQMEKLDEITMYKNLGFSLEEIKELMKNDKREEQIKNKIINLIEEIKEKEIQIRTLKGMLKRTPFVELRPYHEHYKIGKRMTLKKKEDYFQEIKKVKEEIDKYHIPVENRMICNFELGYVEEDIDCFIGYTLVENEIPKEKGTLEVITNSRAEKMLIGHGTVIENIYKEMISYAHNHNIQIRDYFTAILYEQEIEVYAEAYDLEEINKDFLYYLEHHNITKELDDSLIGTYQIREILPNTKYMFNPKKQKSMLDTKYKVLELKEDGTTNFDNIHWNKKELIIEYEGKEIPCPIHKATFEEKEYIDILMNESNEFYKSQRPMEYLYEKI